MAYHSAEIKAPPKATSIPAAPNPPQPVLPVKDPHKPTSRSLCDKFGHKIVTFTVGVGLSGYKNISVHKEILCEKAEYFKKMFTRGFIAATALAAHMREDDPEAFKLLVGWIYTGEIDVLQANHISAVIELYGVAEKFIINGLADDTVAHLIGYVKTNNYQCEPSQIALGYKTTH